LAKSIIVPPTWVALLIWAMVKVPPSSGLLSKKAELSGSALSWAWLGALNSALGSFSTLGVNIPDFTVSHTSTAPSPHLLMFDDSNPEIC
jgi:NCS1 family nucleobase:cation symporter-1